MKILYLGDASPYSGSFRRSAALGALGHEVTHFDPEAAAVRGRWPRAFHFRTGYRFVAPRVRRALASFIGERRFDLAWIDGGAVIGPAHIGLLRARAGRVFNYHNDDPTGRRDWMRWASLRRAAPSYDLIVTVREVTRRELLALGAPKVKRVFMSYDEELLGAASPDEGESVAQLLFVGTWMPERGPILAELLRRGVPLAIRGDRWDRAPERAELAPALRGGPVYGPEYARAVRGSRICLGLLSRGNRDLHTIRSSEIPFLGSLLCAERTSEHQAMYADGEQAVLWSDAAECAERCRALLADEPRRRRIAAAGHRRVRELRLSHREVLAQILAEGFPLR